MNSLPAAIAACWHDGHHVALGIFRFLIPIVILVRVLEVSGLIPWLSMPMRPVMDLIGLPAELSLAWISCVLVSMYSGLMVLISLAPQLPELTVAQMTVFGVLVLIAHSLVLEVRIAGQCGVSMRFQFFLRLCSGILAAFLLHLVLDGFHLLQHKAVFLLAAEESAGWGEWLLQQTKTLAQMYVIICAVMLLQRFLDAFRISDLLGRLLGPVLREILRPFFQSAVWKKIPIVSNFFVPGTYFIVLLFGISVSFYRKNYKQLFVFGFWGAYWFTLLISPVALVRYAYPVIMCLPLMLSLITQKGLLSWKRERKNTKNG